MKTRISRFLTLGVAVAALLVAGGCANPIDAIGLSKTSIDFQLNPFAEPFQVWNNNPQAGTLTITIHPSESWILIDEPQVTSDAPPTTTGPFDRQTIQVQVDRSQLGVGRHEGEIVFRAAGVVSVTMTVAVTQDTAQPADDLEIVNIAPTYTEPYLLDFTFSLRYGDGDQVVAEPAQFEVQAFEDGEALGAEAPVFFRRGQARQLKLMLVLDYTSSLQQAPGAIRAMEDAAKNVLLPALNETAQVGVIEFHSQFDRFPPMIVQPLTVDRQLVRDRIDIIQEEFVQGLAGGSRAWDACVLAAEQLEAGNAESEERVIVLFSDGNDTSSNPNTLTDVIDAANTVGAKIYAVGFGDIDEESRLNLQLITGATGGTLFPAERTEDLADAFDELVDSLSAQYVLRWATLRRSASETFRPSFSLSLTGTGDAVSFNGAGQFDPTDYEGDEFSGRLRFVASDSADGTTVFLRADYMPPGISRVRMFVGSEVDFDVAEVESLQDGLLSSARVSRSDAPDLGGSWILLESTAGPIPYAAFGPLLRFDFEDFLPEDQPLFEQVYIDNDIYAAGQTLTVEGFANTPPE